MKTVAAIVAGVALLATPADARHGTGSHHHRDPAVPHDFMKTHPCPANGHTSGPCPGYVRDHVKPLCKGGPDSAGNMQWQSTAEGKAKDKWECK